MITFTKLFIKQFFQKMRSYYKQVPMFLNRPTNEKTAEVTSTVFREEFVVAPGGEVLHIKTNP